VSRTLLEEFDDLGVEIHDAYGLTEAPLVTMNVTGRNRAGTVGEPLPETEVKISDEGEIMVRGPQVARSYTSGEVPLENGYLATGDLGEIDGGYLVVDGRKKELIKTSYGKYVQPGRIEAMLRSIKDVEEAMVVGEGRPFCVALIWVKADVDKARATERVNSAISEVNIQLSHPEQIKRWATLEYDLTITGGDLTPNLKLKRAAISARFKDVIEGLYEGHLPAQAAGNLLEVRVHA
jgi:long-chain acyl-CoA synthetase